MIETSTPARPATGKESRGDIESFSGDIAENGYTIRLSRKTKKSGGKGDIGPSYNSETYVFPTAAKLVSFLKKELQGAGASDTPADDAAEAE